MTVLHSRVSFGQAVRAAKRAGTLSYYSANQNRRLALLIDGQWHRFNGHNAGRDDRDWAPRRQRDGATDAGDWRAECRAIDAEQARRGR